VTATAVLFHVTHRALTKMRLVTTVALKRGRNHTPSHADCLLEPHSWAGLKGPLLCWNFTSVDAFLQHVMFSGGVAVLFTPCARTVPERLRGQGLPGSASSNSVRVRKNDPQRVNLFPPNCGPLGHTTVDL